MLCQIAELLVEVPASDGMGQRCLAYASWSNRAPDIVLHEAQYQIDQWPTLGRSDAVYLESGFCFYGALLRHGGLMLHASAAAMGGKAYLFSGQSCIGKSTHTRLWQAVFGDAVSVFNDDKPALRRIGGRWIAYGTPWCGKDGINRNESWPLAGICFLVRGTENNITRLTPAQAVPRILSQTTYRLYPAEMDLLLGHVDKLATEIPCFELASVPEQAAARLSYETMRRAAEEEGL